MILTTIEFLESCIVRIFNPTVALTLVLACWPVGAMAQNAEADAKLLASLEKFERASWEAAMKDDKEYFRTFMAPEYKGFLADGSMVTRADFIRNLDDFHLTSFTMGKVSMLKVNEDAVMLTYTSAYEGVHKMMKENMKGIETSSLWVRRGEKWLNIFYQETIGAPKRK